MRTTFRNLSMSLTALALATQAGCEAPGVTVTPYAVSAVVKLTNGLCTEPVCRVWVLYGLGSGIPSQSSEIRTAVNGEGCGSGTSSKCNFTLEPLLNGSTYRYVVMGDTGPGTAAYNLSDENGTFTTVGVHVQGFSASSAAFTGWNTSAVAALPVSSRSSAVSGLVNQPGSNHFFAELGDDGRIFVANYPQQFKDYKWSTKNTTMNVFDPSTMRGTAGVVKSLVTKAEISGNGGDLNDLQFINVGGRPRIAYNTFMPMGDTTNGNYPNFGFLDINADGTVTDATDAGWTGAQIVAKSAAVLAGKAPDAGNLNSISFGEMARLPRTNKIVANLYGSTQVWNGGWNKKSSGGIAVMNDDGSVDAIYDFPEIQNTWTTLQCDANTKVLTVMPRHIEVDPSSAVDDERFIINYDVGFTCKVGGVATGESQTFPMQEFRYKASTRTLSPVSAPVLTGEVGNTGSKCRASFMDYDDVGNLFVAQNACGVAGVLPVGGKIAVYAKINGKRKLETTGCGFVSTQSMQSQWNKTCAPDVWFSQSQTYGGSTFKISWWADAHTFRSASTGQRYFVGLSVDGYMLRIKYNVNATTGAVTEGTRLMPLHLGLNTVPAETNGRTPGTTKMSVDPARGMVWVPSGRGTNSETLETRSFHQYLFGVRVEQTP